jgi:hypothetical protein
MMTRKDYVSVAQILHAHKTKTNQESFNELVSDFCDLFFYDNPNFSPTRFEVACNG